MDQAGPLKSSEALVEIATCLTQTH